MDVSKTIFACAVTNADSERQACLLAESIRAHAGRYSSFPLWVFIPENGVHLSDNALGTFGRLDVRTIPFSLDADLQEVPFAGKVLASAVAEQQAEGKTGLLVWMDPDSIIIQEPSALALEPGEVLGCRPVDHLLIGSPYNQPIDDFWHALYKACGVSLECLFPMTTSADEVEIRPYVNAGLLVVRPEAGLLRKWRECFQQILATDSFARFFRKDVLYKIFLHQAILAGAVMTTHSREQIQILSHLVNYPLHMHQHIPAERRPARMNELISGRYDTFFQDPDWPQSFPSDEPLRGWLARQVVEHGLIEG
jgi:hypothetical protein